MYGTELTVPAVINRVISTGPVETQLIYMLAPEKLAGLSADWNGDPSNRSGLRGIPVIGKPPAARLTSSGHRRLPDIVLEGKT
jgi:ABC-type Fe3+-hydroxamate transport system substrate-binding protein